MENVSYRFSIKGNESFDQRFSRIITSFALARRHAGHKDINEDDLLKFHGSLFKYY
jgi:hypothetical protein